ncbi:MAG TPA: tetratricopeptide repeat protein [Sphingomicrobium sp.]|nr:tetratricopeptide repeat protein [Sphingomicrobium sp.]
MNGWIALGLLVAATIGGLWLMRLRGAMLQLAAAALLFGCAGYAVQGHPSLADSPRSSVKHEPPIPLTQFRRAFFGQFTGAESWIRISESLASRGNSEDAVGALRAAVREHPDDPELWIALGNALTDHAMMLTPASEFAFRRAAELAPGHPAPTFFLGLALARSGDAKNAVALWKNLLAKSPADAEWRPLVEDGIAALEQPPGR